MPDITEQVGFFNARIDQMIYRMGFDLSSRTATVVINTGLIDIRRVRIGAVVIGGLNPVAIAEESGMEVFSRALSSLVDYERSFSYTELESRIRNAVEAS